MRSFKLQTNCFLQMFNHVLSIEREVIWTYGSVTCSAYPLENTDSINSITGNLDSNSALALAVYGVIIFSLYLNF